MDFYQGTQRIRNVETLVVDFTRLGNLVINLLETESKGGPNRVLARINSW